MLINDMIAFFLMLGNNRRLNKYIAIRVAKDRRVNTIGNIPVRNSLNIDVEPNILTISVYEKNQSNDKNVSLDPPTFCAGPKIPDIISGYFILLDIDAVIS